MTFQKELIFNEGDPLYDDMLECMRKASHHIRLESYIFADDEVGQRFAEALIERAANGVDVRVHLDAAGSIGEMSSGFRERLEQHGIQVRIFHRWSWRRPLRYLRRNHRKLLVIDDVAAYLGGFNIDRDNSRRAVGDTRWRDTHVRVQGKLVSHAAYLFDAMWRGRRKVAPAGTPSQSQLVPNHTRRIRHRLRRVLTRTFGRAREHIYVTAAYFVPGARILRALTSAAQRGVDVCLLLPGPTDVPPVQWAARGAYAGLLAAGARVYEYQPRVLHAKTICVDGRWATIGSANMDYRSMFLNYELNLVTHHRPTIEALEKQFEEDLEESKPVNPSVWANRPWQERLLEGIGWLLQRWL